MLRMVRKWLGIRNVKSSVVRRVPCCLWPYDISVSELSAEKGQ